MRTNVPIFMIGPGINERAKAAAAAYGRDSAAPVFLQLQVSRVRNDFVFHAYLKSKPVHADRHEPDRQADRGFSAMAARVALFDIV